MAPKKGSPKPITRAADSSENPTNEDLAQINLYDGSAVRNELDTCTRTVILEMGIGENVTFSNIKLACGLLAICFALFAQFGPGKWPDTWWTVAGCVAAYVLLYIVITAVGYLYERDAFFISMPTKAYPDGFRVASIFHRLEHEYELAFESCTTGNMVQRQFKVDIADLFHSDGYLAEEAAKKKISDMVLKFLSSSTSSKSS